jgi:hypothetical protein
MESIIHFTRFFQDFFHYHNQNKNTETQKHNASEEASSEALCFWRFSV